MLAPTSTPNKDEAMQERVATARAKMDEASAALAKARGDHYRLHREAENMRARAERGDEEAYARLAPTSAAASEAYDRIEPALAAYKAAADAYWAVYDESQGRLFYAIEIGRPNRLRAFEKKAIRDQWIATLPDERMPASALDPLVRRVLRALDIGTWHADETGRYLPFLNAEE